MGAERNIMKNAVQAGQVVFDYKPRELTVETHQSARNFVEVDQLKSPDFKISDLVAKQVGISQLESEAHEGEINERVLKQVKEIEERAYKEGFDLGFADGTDKAFAHMKEQIAFRISSLDKLLAQVESQRRLVLVENEAELISLVFQVAKKIALRDLEEHREAVVEILTKVVDEMSEDETVAVYLSHDDHEFIQLSNEKTSSSLEKIKKLKLIESEEIKPGGCLLETSFGSVDATVDERVERTWDLLRDRIPHKHPTSEG